MQSSAESSSFTQDRSLVDVLTLYGLIYVNIPWIHQGSVYSVSLFHLKYLQQHLEKTELCFSVAKQFKGRGR